MGRRSLPGREATILLSFCSPVVSDITCPKNLTEEAEMPKYQYVCTACGHDMEVRQSFTDDALTDCPACEGRLRKVFSAVGVHFKGSGFYKTDSRAADAAASKSKASGSSDSSQSSDGAGSADSSTGASGGSSTAASSQTSSTSSAAGTSSTSGAATS